MLYSLPAVARSAPPIRLIEQTVSICPLTWLRHAAVQRAFEALLAAGVVVRDMRAYPQLGDALRISLGTPEQNDRVLAALATLGNAAGEGREAACA